MEARGKPNITTNPRTEIDERRKENRTMKPRLIVSIMNLMLTFALVLASTTSVFAGASDTAAGTAIGNMATLNYTLSGGGSFTLESTEGGNDDPATPGSDTTFVVDRKVRPVVTGGDSTDVISGGSGQYITFSVYNDGNSTEDFQITRELAGTPVTQGITYIYDSNNDGPDGGDSTLNLGDVLTLAQNETVYIYVVADTVDPSPADGSTQTFHLVATAWDSGAGSALDNDTGGPDVGTAEIVWADDSGTAPSGDTGLDSGSPDGLHSDSGTFNFREISVTISKTHSILIDPYGLGYNLPGVTLQYTITIVNSSPGTGDKPAFLTTLQDVIESSGGDGVGFSLETDSVDVVISGTSRSNDSVVQSFTDASGDDAVTFDGTKTLDIDFSTILPAEAPDYELGELNDGETVTITYNVLINGAL